MAETTKDSKIVRVEMEFDDGRILRLTGEAAEKWLEAANSQAAIGSMHGFPFPEIKWETFTKTKTPEKPWLVEEIEGKVLVNSKTVRTK